MLFRSHVEMMMLHGGGGVNSSQGGANVYHEFVIEAPMIQIMTESSYEHGQTLQHAEFARTVFEDAVDAVGDVEAVAPVVVGHGPIILFDCDEKSHLEQNVRWKREIMN